MPFYYWLRKINRGRPILSIYESHLCSCLISLLYGDVPYHSTVLSQITLLIRNQKMEPVAENYQLKWHSFNTHLHSCVAAALSSESFTDVALVTLDGHRIPAHRFVLSACSQYLHQILKLQHKVASTLPIIIILPPEINYRTMKILIEYMYSGETTVSKDILENVLRGGDILKVRGLWRPREDDSQKKLVKLHHKPEPSPSPKSLDGKGQPSTKMVEVPENSKEQPTNGASTTPSDLDDPKIPTTSQDVNRKGGSEEPGEFLVIKEEPIEWSEVAEGDMELVDESEMFHTEMTIKPEIYFEGAEAQPEELYTPLTCELCTETFALPGDWVRHIQSHTDMMPAKRQRRGKTCDDDNGSFPPLQCDMCQKYYPTPAEWVHHVQNTHTETELRQSNKKNPVAQAKMQKPIGPLHKVCSTCNKKFPSHASMLIHKRTHTGEKPFMCEFCCKGFNVKSNLLRHLRTLHDRIVCSGDIDYKEESGVINEQS